MSIARHLGVFAFDMAGPSAYTSGSAGWMFGNQPDSISRYFNDCSGGAIALTAEVFNVTPNAREAAAILQMPLDRLPRLENCVNAVRAAGYTDLRRFDALVFCIFGGVCDTGSRYVVDQFPGTPARHIPTAIFDELAMHNMVCHEVGHIIGLDHGYWLDANTGFFYGEYGDPTDVMSSSGAVPGAFAIPPDPASGIAANSALWTAGGPGLSPAIVWRYLPGFPSPQPWVHILDPHAPAITVGLQRAGRPWTSFPSLIVIPVPGGWWTVEYRGASGWDRAFETEATFPAHSSGLVIHRISDLGTGLEHFSFPRSQQVQYVATVPVPPSGDLDWDNGQLGIRFLAETPVGVRVRVGRTVWSPGDNPTLRLDAADPEYTVISTTPFGVEKDVPMAGPNCTAADVIVERVDASALVVVETQTNGYLAPRFRFEVEGVPVGSDASSHTLEQGSFSTSVNAMLPTSRSSAVAALRSITISWKKTGNRLELTLAPGDGSYSLRIKAFAYELGTATAKETQQSVEVVTSSIELPDSAADAIANCWRRRLNELLRIRGIIERVPHAPIPIDGPDWEAGVGVRILDAIGQVNDLEIRSPYVARMLRSELAAGLGLDAGALMQLSDLMRHYP